MEVSMPFSPANASERRRMLLRSTGSFSIIEENIIVPTPRKLSSVPSSPVRNRRDKRKSHEESLFGEAGQEIQTILLQSLGESSPPRPTRILEIKHAEDDEIVVPPPRVSISLVASPVPSPPIRASNPMISNTPFHRMNEDTNAAAAKKDTLSVRLASRMHTKRAKELKQAGIPKNKACRFRSASWPSLTKIEPKPRKFD